MATGKTVAQLDSLSNPSNDDLLPIYDGATSKLHKTTITEFKQTIFNSPTLVQPAIGTPASGTLTNCTGLPVSTGISGLGTGIATFLATPSSANLASAVTDETGSGSLVFGTNPTISGLTLTGSLTVGGTTGTSGYFLQTTGTGVTWAPAGGGGSTTLAGLTDVAVGSQTNGQALVWDSATSKWKPGNVTSGTVITARSTTTAEIPLVGRSTVYLDNADMESDGFTVIPGTVGALYGGVSFDPPAEFRREYLGFAQTANPSDPSTYKTWFVNVNGAVGFSGAPVVTDADLYTGPELVLEPNVFLLASTGRFASNLCDLCLGFTGVDSLCRRIGYKVTSIPSYKGGVDFLVVRFDLDFNVSPGVLEPTPLEAWFGTDGTLVALYGNSPSGRFETSSSSFDAPGYYSDGSEIESLGSYSNGFFDLPPSGNYVVEVTTALNWNAITNTPTTLSGYGITDAQPLLTRSTVVASTTSLAAGATFDFTLATGKVAQVLVIQSSQPGWVRLYGSAASRSADTRTSPGGTLPAAGSGFYAEVVTTTASQTIMMSPVATVSSGDGLTYGRLVNTDTTTQNFTITFTVLTLEA